MNEITPPATFPYQPISPARRKRKQVLGAAGTVLGLAAGAFLGKWAVHAALGGPEDAGRYKLVPPASFQGLALQESGPRVDAIKQGQGTPKKGTTPVAVVYADPSGTAQLVVSGAAGTFTDDDPGAALTRGLHDMGVNGAVTEDSGAPAGGAMRCGTVPVGAEQLTMCMWADHSSLVTVTVPVENKPVALDALAAQTRALRGAMEVPAGS
ncbi:hypothetical protein [Streptomyces katrae]|uniref:Uncharacterized protein n=1 Tax=Streptomyces katrae TaxID=68223 RepID=A0A0F4JJ70_9ACTN|nr:hypothetical protein [Streptomyces katrae]KJY32986.1 hypothetical protein VR44_14800 [Streptomyces katrae]